MSEIEGTIVEAKADHDARELGIEQLCEQIGQLRTDLAAREAEVERLREESKILRDGFTGYRETMRCEIGRLIAEVELLRDAERQRVAEGMSAWCSPPDEQAANAKRQATKGGEAELAAGGCMKPTVYTVHAYRWGDRECHSYSVGVYAKKHAAIMAAQTERDYRGGKYECEVIEWTLDTSIAGNHDNAAKVIKPLPPMNNAMRINEGGKKE